MFSFSFLNDTSWKKNNQLIVFMFGDLSVSQLCRVKSHKKEVKDKKVLGDFTCWLLSFRNMCKCIFLPLYMNIKVSHRHIHRRGSFTTRRDRRPVRCPSDRGMSSIIPPSQVERSECGPPSRSLQTHRDCGRSLSNQR